MFFWYEKKGLTELVTIIHRYKISSSSSDGNQKHCKQVWLYFTTNRKCKLNFYIFWYKCRVFLYSLNSAVEILIKKQNLQ